MSIRPNRLSRYLSRPREGEQTIAAVCREHGIAENTFYRWRKTYGGMSVSEIQRLKELERRRTGVSNGCRPCGSD